MSLAVCNGGLRQNRAATLQRQLSRGGTRDTTESRLACGAAPLLCWRYFHADAGAGAGAGVQQW